MNRFKSTILSVLLTLFLITNLSVHLTAYYWVGGTGNWFVVISTFYDCSRASSEELNIKASDFKNIIITSLVNSYAVSANVQVADISCLTNASPKSSNIEIGFFEPSLATISISESDLAPFEEQTYSRIKLFGRDVS